MENRFVVKYCACINECKCVTITNTLLTYYVICRLSVNYKFVIVVCTVRLLVPSAKGLRFVAPLAIHNAFIGLLKQAYHTVKMIYKMLKS